MRNTSDIKKHLLHLVERYGAARVLEARADSRDAGMATLKRHSERISKALADIGMEVDKFLSAADDLERALTLLDMATTAARSGTDLTDAWADEIDLIKGRHAAHASKPPG